MTHHGPIHRLAKPRDFRIEDTKSHETALTATVQLQLEPQDMPTEKGPYSNIVRSLDGITVKHKAYTVDVGLAQTCTSLFKV